MKIIVLPIVLMISTFAHAQEVFTTAVFYKLVHQLDSLNERSQNIEYCELLLNDSTSLFQSINYGKLDSLAQIEYKNGNSVGAPMSAVIEFPTKLHLKINKTQDEMHHYEKVPASGFYGNYKITESKISPDQWVIQPDTKEINNLPCQKALLNFGGRSWTAWFSLDIPISDGPYKFSGLPGLIVALVDSTASWKFELIGIQSETVRRVHIDTYSFFKTRALSNDEFFKMKRFSIDNQFEIEVANGLLKGVEDDIKEEIKQHFRTNAKNDNNWIELHP